MGTSDPESRPWSLKKILSIDPKSILDIGAGSGTYYDALLGAGYSGQIDAVEVWEPYINEFELKNKYSNVFQIDVREVEDFFYDVVIFGDILEHMTKDEALSVWDRVSKRASYALIAIPIINYYQDEINGNPYERHVKDDWTHKEVLDSFTGIIDSWQGNIVGAYWAKF